MKLILFAVSAALTFNSFSQLTVPPNGGNKKAMVGERIGITDITIHYDRPGVKGREGKIWGQLVPYGFNDLGFGTSKSAPWRAGANENTTIEFSTNVKVEGKELPAGKYGFFIAADAEACTLIFSKNFTSWGSFFYDAKEDALRVQVKPVVMNESTEWLKYEFTNQTDNSATINLLWEKWRIPFTVEVDLNTLQLESFRQELRGSKGFTWNAWNQAAKYVLDNNTNLEEGLVWADKAINLPFVGESNFVTLSTKAQFLEKKGNTAGADSLMKRAMPMASMIQLHGYARDLVKAKRSKEALNVFKANYDKYPNTFTTNVGLARGYSATGNYPKSLEYAQKALAQAPDSGNKVNVEKMIGLLKEGKDIN